MSPKQSDTLLGIPAPKPDSTTSFRSLLFDETLMSPDSGWEFLRASNGFEADSIARHAQESAYFVFYNKYTGVIRPLAYYTGHIGGSHYQWEISTSLGDLTSHGIVASPLNREAVDSNLWTYKTSISRRKLRLYKSPYARTWIADDFDIHYDPCACTSSDLLWFNLAWIDIRDTTINGVAAIIERGPFWVGGIGGYFGGRDTTARSPHATTLVPFYDSPLGTWTLLRTPLVQMECTSTKSLGAPSPDVSVRLAIDGTLLQVINPHVFESGIDVPNRLVYILTLKGDILPMSGLRQIDDTLWASTEIDALCANSEPLLVRFQAKGSYELGQVRIALAPLLQSRHRSDSVRSVQRWMFFATRAILTDHIRTATSCSAIRTAHFAEVEATCNDANNVGIRRRSRAAILPTIDTLPSEHQYDLTIAPNPATDRTYVTVQLEPGESIVQVLIYNSVGQQQVVTSSIPNGGTSTAIVVDTTLLSSGVYVVWIETSQTQHQSALVVVR
ncbi:MAG TPA: T9SS type A sorting domain-containing protein [Candidatus Didemnitutus sp.]|nr:T9SS type A sorting domain-containing protein [Candidatus Didemnitutus sp.]